MKRDTPRASSPTPAMRRVLGNAIAGRPLAAGLSGRAAHGGLAGTVAALRRRGWLTGDTITDGARAALGASAASGRRAGLSDAQLGVLEMLNPEWDGTIDGPTANVLRSLERRGLARHTTWPRECWSITDAGRATLLGSM